MRVYTIQREKAVGRAGKGLARARRIAAAALVLAGLVTPARAGSWRARAREHFDRLDLRYGSPGGREHYSGLTNTMNVWYEEPFRYALGFSISPIAGLGQATTRGSPPAGTNAKIRLWNLGFEGKLFPWRDRGLFARAGLTGNILETRGSRGALGGAGALAGLGWEFKVRRLGIAPEAALRYVLLEGGGRIIAFTPSIGFHFYAFPGMKSEGR